MQRGSAAGKLGDETNKAKLFEVFMQSSKSYLEARGIRPETAQAHRLEIDTAPTAERIIQRLGDDIQIAAGQPLSVYAKELLWFPFQNSDGAITSWSVRIFPTPANGPKFLVAKGSNNAPYIPLGTWAVMGRVDVPVVVTEGPSKLWRLLQDGFPAIGLNGVYGACARDADDKIILHPLLASFAWLKRSVYLAFDADITTKFERTQGVVTHIPSACRQQAEVFTIISWDGSEAKGIDDFLAKSENPAADLELLIKDRTPFVETLEKTPADLRLVEEELKVVVLPRLQRGQVVRQIARKVGVPCKELLDAITPTTQEAPHDMELKVVDLTEPWPGPVDGLEMLKELYTTYGRPVWISDAARMMLAFWNIAEYDFKVWDKFPYLRIKSPDRNCGKSTLINTLERVVYKPFIGVSPTEASLFWLVQKEEPTLLLDNLDDPERIKEVAGLLDEAYDANRVVPRCQSDTGKLFGYRTFGPKVIASIRKLPGTTESRSLVVDIVRVPADKERQLEELCDIDPTVFLNLKRKILAFVEDHKAEFRSVRPARPDWLKTRDWDLWKPLFTVADIIGGPAPNWVRAAAVGLFKDRVIEESLAIEILSHIRDAANLRDADNQLALVVVARKEDKHGKVIKSGPFIERQKLVDYCNGIEEASWADWKTGDREGLTIRRFAKELWDDFKIERDRVTYEDPKTQTVRRIYGYWLEPFESLFESYLPPVKNEETITDDEENKNVGVPPENTPEPSHVNVTISDSTTSSGSILKKNRATPRFEKRIEPEEVPKNQLVTEAWLGSSLKIAPTLDSFLAIDVETSAELERRSQKFLETHLTPQAELRIISAATSTGNVIVHDLRKGPLPDYLRTAIATMPLLAHGAAFDLAVLGANGIKTSGNVFCTLTASRLLTAGLRDSNDLGAVLKRHLGLELPKEFGASDWGGLFVTDEQLEYCRNDVVHLHALQRALQAKLANPANDDGDGVEGTDLTRVAALEMSLIPMVVDIRLRGIKIDRARLEQILRTYEGRKKELATELRTEFQAPKLNFASPKQLLRAFKTLGLELSDTSKETLSTVVEPVAGRILRYRELAGLCTTLEELVGRSGPRQPSLSAAQSLGGRYRPVFLPETKLAGGAS